MRASKPFVQIRCVIQRANAQQNLAFFANRHTRVLDFRLAPGSFKQYTSMLSGRCAALLFLPPPKQFDFKSYSNYR